MPITSSPSAIQQLRTHMNRTVSVAAWATVAMTVLSGPVVAIDWDAYTAAQVNQNAAPSADNKTLDISAGGNLTKTSGVAATNTNKTGTKISINTTSGTDGISSTDENATVSISGTGVLDQLTVTKGTITGNATNNGLGTVMIDGASSSTAINIGTDGVISSTGTGGDAIVIGGTNTFTGSITNAGSITTTSDANSIAIDVASKTGSTIGITNTGTINAGASGKAINIGANTKATIAQNSGTITGAVILGDHAGSTLAVSGGTIAGNVTMNNAAQQLTLGGGQINGTINGAGLVTVNNAYTSNGNIGATTGITKLTINDGKSLNAAVNNNSIKATNVVVGSGGAGTAVLTLGTGAVTGAIDGDVAGKGTVNLNGSQTLGGNIGENTALGSIAVGSGATIDAATGNRDLRATNVSVADTGVLQLGTTAVTGTINGAVAGKGTVAFKGSQTVTGTVGATNALAAVTVADGVTLGVGQDMKATNLTIGEGASGIMNHSAGTITATTTLGAGAKYTQSGTAKMVGGVNLGAGSHYTLDGGQGVTGVINGDGGANGTVTVNSNYVPTAHIGSGTSISKLVINDGKTFDAASNNTTIKATNVVVGSGGAGTAVLTLGTGAVTGAIDGDAAGKGKVNLNGSQTLGGNIGANTALESITIANGTTIDAATGNRDLRATNVTLGNTATLQLGTAAVTGSIDGAAPGQGTIAFKGSQTTTGTIGATQKLAAATVGDGANVVLNNSLNATNVTVGGGASGKLTVNGGKTLTGTVAVANGGTLELTVGATPGTINGAIDGTSAGKGTLALIGGSGTLGTDRAIGATNSLAAVTVGDGLTVNLGHNINATNVTVGGGASGVMNHSAGTITATTTTVGGGGSYTQSGTGKIAGNVAMGAGSNLTIAGGNGITGTIDGAGGANGTVTVKTAYTNAGAIGSVNGISALEIANGGALTLGADVNALDTNIGTGSRLLMGNTARTVTGNITGTNTGVINLGGAAHTLSGNLTTAATNSLGLTINTNAANDSGRLTVGGTTNIASGTRLDVNVAAPGYIATGTRYTIISGTNAEVNNTSIVDNSTILNFSEDLSVAGKRTLVAERTTTYNKAAQSFNTQNVGAVLEGIGSAGTGELGQFQARLDALPTSGQVDQALQEVVPQSDNSLSAQTVSATLQSNNLVSARLASVRAGTTYAKAKSGVASGNHSSDAGVWVQGFGSKGDQGARNGVAGYDARTMGGAVGIDTITSDNGRGRMGISGSYAQTDIKAKGPVTKETDVNSYQANLYGTYNGDKAYVEGMMGVAFHNFEGRRYISAPSAVAKSEYNGFTYTASGSTGYRFAMGRNIDIVPHMGVTYFANQMEDYTETGAGTLNLNVENDHSQALIGKLGMNLGYTVRKPTMFIRPELRFAYLHDFIGDKQATTARFTGGGATFRTEGFAPAQDSYVLGASLNLVTQGGFSFNADYDYEMKESFDSHSGLLRARVDL